MPIHSEAVPHFKSIASLHPSLINPTIEIPMIQGEGKTLPAESCMNNDKKSGENRPYLEKIIPKYILENPDDALAWVLPKCYP
jgi:hypothetical protein